MINYHEWWETETKNLISCLKREYYLIGKIKTPYTKNKKPKKTPENKQVFDHTDYKESTYNTMSGTILNALHMLDLLIFKITPWSKYYYSILMMRKLKAERG